jgi:omega-6 fatty acid desaturase (delta-12 desaturase)
MMERCYRTPLGLGLFYFVEIHCKCVMFPARDRCPKDLRAFYVDRLIVCLFLVSQFIATCWISVSTGRQHPVLFSVFAVFTPFLVFTWLMGFITFQQHTNPAIPWFDGKREWTYFQGQVLGTAHVRFPRVMDFLFLNIFEHTAHHVDPLIPLYQLAQSQSALETAFPGVITKVGASPMFLWDTTKRCKLYDYREHCWLDFNGNRTTPNLITATDQLAG